MRTDGDPLVSVVLPTYNRSHVLKRAMDSVLQQSIKDIELIVVDDGSIDGTDEIVAACRDSRVRYLRHQTNLGMNVARNSGIRASRGRYLAFQDSDDEWLPCKLEYQLEVLEHGKRRFPAVGGPRLNMTPRGFHPVIPSQSSWDFEDILAGRSIGCGTPLLVVRRSGEEDVLFDERFAALAEGDYLLRVTNGREVAVVRRPLIRVFRAPGPHSAPPLQKAEAIALYLEKYTAVLRDRPEVRSYFRTKMAASLATAGRMRDARRELRRAIEDSPFNPLAYLRYMAGVAGKGPTLILWNMTKPPARRDVFRGDGDRSLTRAAEPRKRSLQ